MKRKDLILVFESLPVKACDDRGFTAQRRVARYGINYDLTTREATPATPIADFRLGVRERSAAFAGIQADAIVQAMVTE
jgi:hypothetical protein